MSAVTLFSVTPVDELEEYPVGRDVRLDSHWFLTWERRRWLNSSMRLLGRPECRAYYFDLINVAFDQTPVGTLPDDMAQLARLVMVPESEFTELCRLKYGPLHLWRPCLSEGERRLYHPHVLQTVLDGISRKEDNRARTEAAANDKRLRRLRGAVTGFHAKLGENDAAILWMDQYLSSCGCQYRNAEWVQRAMQAWSNHTIERRS